MKHFLILLFFLIGRFSIGQELYFPPLLGDEWETTSPATLAWCEEEIDDFLIFLEESNTKGFIVLKDGRIVIESYMNDFTADDTWYWASAGKSLTAFLTGMAQDEGLLSISDKTTEYLGEEWTSCSLAEENDITIRDQLTMTTGLDYSFSFDCNTADCLTCLNPPGDEWYYHNAPYTLITDVIEQASGMSYNGYMLTNLSLKTGINGLWVDLGSNRILHSKLRSMARFGLLMLNNGDWDDEVILADKDYVHDMIHPSQEINPAYGYLWWLNGQNNYRLPGSTTTFDGAIMPNLPDDAYMALGKNGQFILIIPSQNFVMVRMGENPDNSFIPSQYLIDLWSEFEKIQCVSSSKDQHYIQNIIYPNPVTDNLTIARNHEVVAYVVYTRGGQKIDSGRGNHVDTSTFKSGMYALRYQIDNQWYTQLFFKR